MNYLKRRGLRGVSMREFARATEAGEADGLVGLTFDDGFRDFLYNALPVLDKVGFTATVFVVGGKLGGENDWEHDIEPRPRLELLEAEEVREVAERGMEIGAHSMTHPSLPGLEAGILEEEVAGSRRVLGELLGEPVEGFCYPYGDLDEVAVEAVGRAGFSYACAVNPWHSQSAYAIPRIPLAQRDGASRFALKIGVYWQYYATKHKIRGALAFARGNG